MSESGWRVARLDEIPHSGARPEWVPLRRHFGISSFGVNAWTGDAGEQIVGEHEEASLGHEELYVVLRGRATVRVDGETVAAPAGTVVFVRDPAVVRGVRAEEAGTAVLTAGAKPGEAFRPSPWEVNSEVVPMFERGEFAEAKRALEEAIGRDGEAAPLLFNLACAEARLGEREDALAHVRRAVELDERFREHARGDEDLASVRDDPRFPA